MIFDTIIQIVVYMIIFFVLIFAILFPIFLIYDRIREYRLKRDYDKLKQEEKGGNNGDQTTTENKRTGFFSRSTSGSPGNSSIERKQAVEANDIKRELEGRGRVQESISDNSSTDKRKIRLN